MTRDRRPILGVDLGEVDSPAEEVVVVLAERAQDRRGSAVARVGLQAPEQRGENGGAGSLDLLGVGAELVGQLVDGELTEDVVNG